MQFKRAFLSIFLIVLSSYAYSDDIRIDRANKELEKFFDNNTELNQGEYFLASLKIAVPPSFMEKMVDQYQMRLESVHLCTARGVLVVPVKAPETIAGTIGKIDLQKKIGDGHRYVSPVELGEDLTPGNLKLCGFESTMSSTMVKQFQLQNKEIILAIEIGNQKRRFFAINHNLVREDK